MSGLVTAPPDTPRLAVRWIAELSSPVEALAASPDGSSVAVVLADGPAMLLDARTGHERWSVPGHPGGTLWVACSPDGTLIATCGQDGRASLLAAEDGRRIASMDAGAPWAARVAFEPGGKRVVTAAGKLLRLWDRDGSALASWPPRSSTILDVAWRPREAGPPLVAATSYGGIGLYDPLRPHAVAREFAWQGSSLALSWSPDAKYLATGDQDRSVHLWRCKSGKDSMMSGYPRKVRELAWHHTSKHLVTGGGNVPCMWYCGGRGPEGTTPVELDFHAEPVSALHFEPHGDRLVTGALDGTLALWLPLQSPRPVRIASLGDEISTIAWTGPSQFVAGTLGGDVAAFGVSP